jgi:hypothetical protein
VTKLCFAAIQFEIEHGAIMDAERVEYLGRVYKTEAFGMALCVLLKAKGGTS